MLARAGLAARSKNAIPSAVALLLLATGCKRGGRFKVRIQLSCRHTAG